MSLLWRGVGDVLAGMTAEGFNVEVHLPGKQWRASFYAAGIAHSVVYGTGGEATPWRAVSRAAWRAIRNPRMAA